MPNAKTFYTGVYACSYSIGINIFSIGTDPEHPVVKGVGDFDVLFDMPEIEQGNHGVKLMERKDGGAAAVVAGQFGQGRVVLIAPNIGIGERNMERPPEDDALTLLLNAVRWCAGK